MIIEGGSRGDAQGLASHLLKDENERVTIKEIRGCFFDTLPSALQEMEEHALLTKCKNPLYHAHIDWRRDETLTEAQKFHAVDVLEKALGFTGQPRAIVEHVKHGREHLHVVWDRIDLDNERALSDSHNYRKHELAARQLERTFGHARVQGAHVEREGVERPERGYEKWEFQQGKKNELDPRILRASIRECYESSDNGKSLQHALDDEGLLLARGDRRGYVVIDHQGGVTALRTTTVGAREKEIKAKLGDLDRDSLPSVAEAKEQQALRRDQEWERGGEGSNGGATQDKYQTLREATDTRLEQSRIVADDYFDRDAQDRQWHDAIAKAGIDHAKEQDATRAAMNRAIGEMEKQRTRTLRLEQQEDRAAARTTDRDERREAYRIDRDLAANLAIKIARTDDLSGVERLAEDRHMAFAQEDGKIYAVTARHKFEYDPLMQERLHKMFGREADELPGVKAAKKKAFNSERAAAIREGTREAYAQCITDADNGTGFAEHLTKRSGLTLERDQWQTLYVSDGHRHTPLEKLIDAGEQRDHLPWLHEPAALLTIEQFEAKRRYWSDAERAAREANRQRAATVAASIPNTQDLDALTSLQRQHRVVFGQDEKGLLYAVTDRVSVALDGEQSARAREMIGQTQLIPMLEDARRMAYRLEQEHQIRQAVTQGYEQSRTAEDHGQAFIETLEHHHLELHRDHGARLYVSNGKQRIELDPIITPAQQGETLSLIGEQYREIPLFDSTLDRQERFEQRMEDIEAARLQRLIARNVDNAVDLVTEPVSRIADRTGQAARMATGVAGNMLGGVVRVTERLTDSFLGALTDFFTGGTAPAARSAPQREAPPAQERTMEPEKSASERARDYLRSVQPDMPRIDPQTEAMIKTYSQHVTPEMQAHLRRLRESQERRRADDIGRER